jgi:hypothetical protein
MKKNNILLIVLVIIVVVMLASSVVSGITGQSIFEKLRVKPPKGGGKCISNGFECGDCIDNDGDQLKDYKVNKKGKVLGDPDCDSLTDNTEAPCSVECNNNPDCGTNGYIGNPYCGADNNVYKDYRTYTCYNPGVCAANCDSQVDSYLWENCGGLGCSNGICLNGTADSCSDTDGGFVREIQGTASGYFLNQPYSNTDYCTGDSTVMEYYCSVGNRVYSGDVSCITNSTSSCSNGACVDEPIDSCSDSDGGFVIDTLGTVSGYYLGEPYNYTDYCNVNSTLSEYYCGFNNRPYTVSVSCATNSTTVCSAGVCV